MSLPLNSSLDVFMFIIFCSVYVCSVLWMYGDAATRNAGWKGVLLPLLFIIVGTLALIKGEYLALALWPLGYVVWFAMRPAEVQYD
ncbi:MAG: hypothetical protein ACI9SC_001572 [Gammaproteobacteria bacterium]|jgi:hypothetical protein